MCDYSLFTLEELGDLYHLETCQGLRCGELRRDILQDICEQALIRCGVTMDNPLKKTWMERFHLVRTKKPFVRGSSEPPLSETPK